MLGTPSSRGRKEPWKPLVILWAILTGAVAAVLLFVGGLGALQTFTILAATPFVLIIIGLCVSLHVDLRRDPLRQRTVGPVRTSSEALGAVPFTNPTAESTDPGVQPDAASPLDPDGHRP
ncbi:MULTISPECIES: BCCT family transporter [unclassified Cryobacterium]|uniref:BCCT family transporter n=1 Tax=unclassified Cryobacterium TaxID=2649013 RepID=UPI0018E091C6|nr:MULTISPECIES: BCCT family transporter [unclassified Cryobacterium]